jgi:hypothetical protein
LAADTHLAEDQWLKEQLNVVELRMFRVGIIIITISLTQSCDWKMSEGTNGKIIIRKNKRNADSPIQGQEYTQSTLTLRQEPGTGIVSNRGPEKGNLTTDVTELTTVRGVSEDNAENRE